MVSDMYGETMRALETGELYTRYSVEYFHGHSNLYITFEGDRVAARHIPPNWELCYA